MTKQAKLFYDQSPNHGQSPEQLTPFRDKIFKALVDADDDLQTQIDSLVLTGTGDVVGPASAVDERIAVYDGITGKLIKDGLYTIDDLLLLNLQTTFEGALTVNAATTANLAAFTYNNGAAGVGATITINANGVFPTIDGVVAALDNLYLIKNASNGIHRGIYKLTTLGTAGTQAVLTRQTDSDTSAELDAQIVIVGAGTVNKRLVFNQTTTFPVIGTDNILYAQTAAAAGIGVPLFRTLAQMQALRLAFGFQRGREYIIDYVGSTGSSGGAYGVNVMFKALSTSELSPIGVGSFYSIASGVITDAVTFKYVLVLDRIYQIYDYRYNNLYSFFGGPGLEPQASMEKINLDNANIQSSIFYNPVITNNFSAPLEINGCIFENGSTITLDIDCVLIGCNFGKSSTIIMSGTQSLINCTIGDSKTMDFATTMISTYTATGKVYIGSLNTFIISDDDLATPGSLDMAANSGIIDFSQFIPAGILVVAGDNSQKLTEFDNIPLDYEWEVIPLSGAENLMIASVPYGGSNIYLETNTFITLVATDPVDFCKFKTDVANTAMVKKIGGANYVR